MNQNPPMLLSMQYQTLLVPSPHCSSAPVSRALRTQRRAHLTNRSPVLARIAVVDDIEQVRELHVRHACEPMHEALDVGLAATLEAHAVEKAHKEDLHFRGAAERCDLLEACSVYWRISTSASWGDKCAWTVIIHEWCLQEDRSKANDFIILLNCSALIDDNFLTYVKGLV